MEKIIESFRRAGVAVGLLRPTYGDVERAAGMVFRAHVVGDKAGAARAREHHSNLLRRAQRSP